KILAQERSIVFCEAANQFLIEIVCARRGGIAISFLVRRAAFFNIFFQAIVQVVVLAALSNLRLVIELNFVHQQASKALCFAMQVGIFSGGSRDRAATPPGGG